MSDDNRLIYELARALEHYAIAEANNGTVYMCLFCGAVATAPARPWQMEHHRLCVLRRGMERAAQWGGGTTWDEWVSAWEESRGE